MLHKIRIKGNEEEGVNSTKVFVDGSEINGVYAVRFEQFAHEVPICEIGVVAIPEVEALADVHINYTPSPIKYSPQTTKEAADILLKGLIDGNGYARTCCRVLADLSKKITNNRI